MDRESQTLLRSAHLKEELRSRIFRRICSEVLLLLGKHGIPTIVLKGTALAETVYPSPALRHCHDIDLLVGPKDMAKAASLVKPLGFKELKGTRDTKRHHINLQHESGLPLQFHSRLFQVPHYNATLAESWARSTDYTVVGVSARILAPSDSLLHVCGHASYSGSRQSLRWVGDAWLMIARSPKLEWDLLLDSARRNRLLLPLSVTLGYLAEALDAAVPLTFLDRLFSRAARTDGTGRALALHGARSSQRATLRTLFLKAGNWRARALLIQWLLLPSPSYLRWVDQIRRSWLPFHYFYRPAIHAARYVLSRLKRSAHRFRLTRQLLLGDRLSPKATCK